MRLISKLLLLNALAACGGNQDPIFEKSKLPEKSPSVAKATAPAPPSVVSKRYIGWYRRIDDTSQFQPCGAKAPLNVRGTPVGQAQLRERYRFSAPWQGAKMYAVFQGAIVTDTAKAVEGDTGKATTSVRFLITGVDSMRAWLSKDCGGVRRP